MAISARVAVAMQRSSWIRRMFDEGAELKRRFGDDAVVDLSLGNPDLEPPAAFREALDGLVRDRTPGAHRYMANAGLPEARAAVAGFVAREHGVDPAADGVVMTVGAAGALNILFKALFDVGSRVVCPAPFFPEYEFYADNHGGVLDYVPTAAGFALDPDMIARALGTHTRAVLLNAPNNPTGRIYDDAALRAVGAALDAKAPEATLVSDEPYRRLCFVDGRLPSVLQATHRSVVCSSFSKDLGLAGERIGFVAVHPRHPERDRLLAALSFANRTLGFVNAPALAQRAVARAINARVDVAEYRARRDLLVRGLRDAGWDCTEPEGGLFVFPRSPIPDDIAFAHHLAHRHKVLVVPGTGFAGPGFLRMSIATPRERIARAIPAFAAARREVLAGDVER